MTEADTQQAPGHHAGLAARCRAGDPAAWGELVEQYSRYVYAIAVRGFRLSEADAEDVFQDTFLRVYERLETLRDDDALRPWIAQVARRLCLDRIAAAGRSAPGAEGELEGELALADSALEDIEQAMDIRAALASLDVSCRELLDRFFARDEPYRVIADELSLPMGTVASRISRCLAKLRGVLAGEETVAPGSLENEAG